METASLSGFHNLCIWIFRFAYLNALWMLFSLLGVFVLGVFPATAAMLAVERKWIRGEQDFNILHFFWSEYKREFMKVNMICYLLAFFGFLLFMNYWMLVSMNGTAADILTYFLIALMALYAIVCIYLLPVYVHYDIKYMEYIKQAFFVGISSPLMSLLIVLSFVIYFYIGSVFPGIVPLYTGSILSFAVMWFSYCAFTRIEQRHMANS